MIGEAGSETTNITRESLAIHLYFSSDLVERHLSVQWLTATLSARLSLSNRCAIRELKSRRDIPPADSRFMVSPENSGRKLVSRGGFNQIQRSIKRDTSPCGQSHPRIPGGLHWLISRGAQKRNRVRASAPVQILISHSLTTDQLLSRKETSSTPFSGSQIG